MGREAVDHDDVGGDYSTPLPADAPPPEPGGGALAGGRLAAGGLLRDRIVASLVLPARARSAVLFGPAGNLVGLGAADPDTPARDGGGTSRGTDDGPDGGGQPGAGGWEPETRGEDVATAGRDRSSDTPEQEAEGQDEGDGKGSRDGQGRGGRGRDSGGGGRGR